MKNLPSYVVNNQNSKTKLTTRSKQYEKTQPTKLISTRNMKDLPSDVANNQNSKIKLTK